MLNGIGTCVNFQQFLGGGGCWVLTSPPPYRDGPISSLQYTTISAAVGPPYFKIHSSQAWVFYWRGNTIFPWISTEALVKFFSPQVWHLIEGGAYLRVALTKIKLHATKNILTYFFICMKNLQYPCSILSAFRLSPFTSSGNFNCFTRVSSLNFDFTVPFLQLLHFFWWKKIQMLF